MLHLERLDQAFENKLRYLQSYDTIPMLNLMVGTSGSRISQTGVMLEDGYVNDL